MWSASASLRGGEDLLSDRIRKRCHSMDRRISAREHSLNPSQSNRDHHYGYGGTIGESCENLDGREDSVGSISARVETAYTRDNQRLAAYSDLLLRPSFSSAAWSRVFAKAPDACLKIMLSGARCKVAMQRAVEECS